jgi:hypothetical protein
MASKCAGNVAEDIGGHGMGIGKLGSDTLILKRKYRWVCYINNCLGQEIPPYLVKIASRPDLTTEETELNFLNERIWIPGKSYWETITVTFIDAIDPSSGDSNVYLLNWLASIYDFTDPLCRWQSSRRKDYVGQLGLYLLDGCGNPLELWTIGDAWPTSIKFGELDYTSSDTVDIELTLRYSAVSYQILCPPGQTITPCGCTGCPTTIS